VLIIKITSLIVASFVLKAVNQRSFKVINCVQLKKSSYENTINYCVSNRR